MRTHDAHRGALLRRQHVRDIVAELFLGGTYPFHCRARAGEDGFDLSIRFPRVTRRFRFIADRLDQLEVGFDGIREGLAKGANLLHLCVGEAAGHGTADGDGARDPCFWAGA